MFTHCELLILILALTLAGHVHTGEIIGGHEAVAHSRPYMVLLVLHMQDGNTSHCGGFLLNEDFVMTAAHCQAKSHTALLGVHNVRNSTGVQRIPVKHAFPHKDYIENNFKNDIMLLKLSSKANITQNVRPIALADEFPSSLSKSCIVSGWGKTDENKPFLCVVLMEVNVTLIDSERCVKDNMYCSEGDTGPSNGDSGGPLVCEDGNVYGVVSVTFKPDKNGPTVYKYFTKIPDYTSWITETMKGA